MSVDVFAFFLIAALLLHVRTVHKFLHRVFAILTVDFSNGCEKQPLKIRSSRRRRCMSSLSTLCAIFRSVLLTEGAYTSKISTDDQVFVDKNKLHALSTHMELSH